MSLDGRITGRIAEAEDEGNSHEPNEPPQSPPPYAPPSSDSSQHIINDTVVNRSNTPPVVSNLHSHRTHNNLGYHIISGSNNSVAYNRCIFNQADPRPRASPPDNEGKGPWEICLDTANKGVGEEIAGWMNEIWLLLMSAGFLSVIFAIFAVQSYHGAGGDPATLLLRELVVLQHASANSEPSTSLSINLDLYSQVAESAKRAASYHFLSLALGLATIILGILCFQWLREYARNVSDVAGPHPEQLWIRLMRREGLKRWQVLTFIAVLPLILLLSILVFFAGILEQLFGINLQAAGLVTLVITGSTAAFVLLTTVLPSFHYLIPISSHCPYKSPQARVFRQFQVFVRNLQQRWLLRHRRSGRGLETKRDRPGGWPEYDMRVFKRLIHREALDVGHDILWLGRKFAQSLAFAKALYSCIQDPKIMHSLSHALKEADESKARCFASASADVANYTDYNREDVSEEERDDYLQKLAVLLSLEHIAEWFEGDDPSSLSSILPTERLDLLLKILGAPFKSALVHLQYPRVDGSVLLQLSEGMTRLSMALTGSPLGLWRILLTGLQTDKKSHLLNWVTHILTEGNISCLNEKHLFALRDIIFLSPTSPSTSILENVQTGLRTWMSRRTQLSEDPVSARDAESGSISDLVPNKMSEKVEDMLAQITIRVTLERQRISTSTPTEVPLDT